MSHDNEKFRVYICYGGAFEYVNNTPTYLPIDCLRVPLKLPVAPEKPMTCRILLRNVLKKLGLSLDTPVCMKYIIDKYIVDITDDTDDFGEFLQHAISNAPIEIYINDLVKPVSGMGSNKPSSSSSGLQQQFQQMQPGDNSLTPNYHIQFHYHNTIPTQYNPPVTQFCYYNQPNSSEGPQTNQQTPFVSDIPYETPSSEFNVDDHSRDDDHYDEDDVNPPKKLDHPFANPLVEDEDEDLEEESFDPRATYDKPIPAKAPDNDIFWNMPPLLSEQEEDVKQQPVTMYELSERVKVGKTFENKDEFLLELQTKCLEENFQITPIKSDKTRYRAKCVLPNCEWKISAYRIRDSNNFQVRKLNDIHTCSRTQVMSNNRHANKKVLGNILKELMTVNGRVYRGEEIKVDMNKRFKISLSYNQAWRAKCYAIELLRGSMEDSFRILPVYLHNLKLHNPGSKTNVQTDDKGQFLMCYMSIGAAIRAFVKYTRPIIIVDGAHLKGGYLGTNLIAVAMDGNNGILPLAYGIGAGETTDHWAWFFGNLRDALASEGCGFENLTIISDRAPSITAGVTEYFQKHSMPFAAVTC